MSDFHDQVNELVDCSNCGEPVIYDKSMCTYYDTRAPILMYNVICHWCNAASPGEGTQANAELAWNQMNQRIRAGMELEKQAPPISGVFEQAAHPEQQSSVEISQNSKGEPRVTVKVYHANVREATNLAIVEYLAVLRELERMGGGYE